MICAIIQAREDSTRLPNKIFKKIIDSENSLSLILKRLNKSKKIDKVIIAVPNQSTKFDHLKKSLKILNYSKVINITSLKDIIVRHLFLV